jgi:hypothetical protein
VADNDTRGRHVAVLLDFENLIIAFKKRGGEIARAVRVEPIIDFLEDNFGNVIFRRAYADWAHEKLPVISGGMMAEQLFLNPAV